MNDSPLIVFDMDGVITSEEGYWRAAACTIVDLAARLGHVDSQGALAGADSAHLPAAQRIHHPTIAAIKALAINTNWDLCHLAAVMLCREYARGSAERTRALNACDWTSDESMPVELWPDEISPEFDSLLRAFLALGVPGRGFELMENLAQRTVDEGLDAEAFIRKGPLWEWCFHRFQTWFAGSAPSAKAITGAPDRPGIVHEEMLLLSAEPIRETLRALCDCGWTLAVATGRTRGELLPTLRRFGLLEFFDPRRIVTHDEISKAEHALAAAGQTAHLSKPGPFPFLRAIFPDTEPAKLAGDTVPAIPPRTIFVGDTVGDMAPARRLGACGVAVLTGAGGASGELALREAGATDVIADVTGLPALLRIPSAVQTSVPDAGAR